MAEDKRYDLKVTGRAARPRSKRLRDAGMSVQQGSTVVVGGVEGLEGKLDKYIFDDLFEKVEIREGVYAIRAKYGLFTNEFLSAKGIDEGDEGGTGGASYLGQLVNVGAWADQTPAYDRIMVQLAGSTHWTEKRLDEIGGGLDEEQLAAYLTENNYAKTGDIPSLDGYATEAWVTGRGYITSAALNGYATQSWVVGKGYATTSDLDARIDALVNGAPAAFDTLKEIADVLQGNVDSIDDILTTIGTKADKSISISAGTGLTGGGTLSANRTLSLKPATTSALGGIIVGDRLSIDSSGRLTATYTYTHPSATATTIAAATGKVLSAITVNSLGHVTSVAAKTLAAADIPSLAISKITGLQAELDKKLDASVLNDLFEKVTVNGVTAIRAKYGLFTNEFLSAKGMDEGSESPGGGATKLSELTDVSLTNLKNNDLLRWNGTRWVNVPQSSISPSLAWENITGKPSTFPPSAHTHTKSQITDFPATWAWGSISGKPTTLSGYGITDGVNAVTVSGSGNAVTSASISGHKLTLTKGSTFLLSSQYTASDILTKLKTVDGSGSGLDADTLDGYNASTLYSNGYIMFKHTIDASDLDENTYYPVTFSLNNLSNVRIECIVGLNSGTTPSWSTHARGFSVRKIWESNGSGWGANPVNRRILVSDFQQASSDPVRGIGQLTNSSTEYIYVRGGGIYILYTSHNILPILRTSTYTSSSQSVSPTTTAPDQIIRNVALKTDNVYSATKLQTERTINGTSFDGTANITTANWGTARSVGIVNSDGTGTAVTVSVNGGANVNLKLPTTIKASLTGNAATATTLQTARTIWGQSFNGSANVSGAISGATTINASGAVTFGSTLAVTGAVTLKSTLAVTGLITATAGLTTPQYLQVGDGRIYWDATNKALYVKHKDGTTAIGFYAQGWMSAKGVDSGTGGSTGGGNFFGVNVNGSTYRVDDEGYVTIPDYPTSLNWSEISGKPSWIGSTKPSYAWSEITGKPSSFTPSSHTHTKSQISDFPTTWAWGSISGKPTTLAGYGITDGVNDITVSGSGNAVTSASISGHKLTLTKGSTFLLSSQYTASDILTKLKTVDGSGSGLDADTLDGYNASTLYSNGYIMFKHTIDASDLDENTYYPVTFSLNNLSNVRIECIVGLNSGTTPSWSTHARGFSVRKIWESNGSGWGANPVNRRILVSDFQQASSDPVRGIGQLTNSSTEYIYVRGGGIYILYTSHNILPILRTSTYTSSSQSVSPTTTAPDQIIRNVALKTDNVYSATKLQTERTINGTSFDGTANITTANWGTARSVGIVNSDGTGTAVTVSVNGGANVNLKLPTTIKASLTGNAATATTLQTARTIWGQSFNGSANVSGALTGVTNITASGDVTANRIKITDTDAVRHIEFSRAGYNYLSTPSGGTLAINVENTALMASSPLIVTKGRIFSGTNNSTSLGDSTYRWSGLYSVLGNFSGAVTIGNGLNVTGNIVATGAITAKAVSDIRLKTVIQEEVDYCKKLLGLGSVVDFYYNDKAIERNTGAVDKERHIGLIYQQAKASKLVNFCHEDEDGYGSINYLATDYINLIAGALQQTILRQETIEQRVERLERENEELRRQLNNLTAA